LGLTNVALLNCFLGGLNPEIRWDVVAMCPPTLLRVVASAKLFDEKYIHVSKPLINSYIPKYILKYTQLSHTSIPMITPLKAQNKYTLPPLLRTPPGPPVRSPSVKKIIPAEMKFRREKDLCYFCDEMFLFNHKCPNRQFLLLQIEDVNEETPTLELNQGA